MPLGITAQRFAFLVVSRLGSRIGNGITKDVRDRMSADPKLLIAELRNCGSTEEEGEALVSVAALELQLKVTGTSFTAAIDHWILNLSMEGERILICHILNIKISYKTGLWHALWGAVMNCAVFRWSLSRCAPPAERPTGYRLSNPPG
jgi:hypothetical protein